MKKIPSSVMSSMAPVELPISLHSQSPMQGLLQRLLTEWRLIPKCYGGEGYNKSHPFPREDHSSKTDKKQLRSSMKTDPMESHTWLGSFGEGKSP